MFVAHKYQLLSVFIIILYKDRSINIEINPNLMYDTRNLNKWTMKGVNATARVWIWRREQYLFNHGQINEINWINAKIE